MFATVLVVSFVSLTVGCGGGATDDPTAKKRGDAIRLEDEEDGPSEGPKNK